MTDTTNNNPAENQINFWGKLTAGLLLIFLTSSAIYFVIAYWPNKMPPIEKGDDGAWFTNQRFKVTLIEKTDCALKNETDSLQKISDSTKKIIAGLKDSIKASSDSVRTDSLQKLRTKLENEVEKRAKQMDSIAPEKRIHLNTILLLMVAMMGFLGNMVHIATSFTTFVGMGTFQRNWVLWYFVKPFTAAGLAIIVYFIIRAGFLSYGSGASSVSLYGILALSALAGLFTDSATLKLKEVFEVIFKPKDERTGKLQGDGLTISAISPDPIPAAGDSMLTVTGKNLNMAGLKITIDGIAVTPVTNTAEKLEIKYTPAAGATKAVLVFADKSGNVLSSKEIAVK